MAPRTRTRVLLGVSDQVLSSLTSFGTSFVAARLLGADRFGQVAAALSVGVIALAFGRALVGDTLLPYAAAKQPAEQRRMGEDATAAALLLGVVAGVVCVLVGLLPFALTRYVGWMGVWLPAILVQDAIRYRFYVTGEILGAVITDAVWVLGEAALIGYLLLGPGVTEVSILTVWGLGALLGAIVGLALVRSRLRHTSPTRWLRESVHLSGWFTAQVSLAQAQAQGVVFVVGGVLSTAALGGLRSIQLVLVQPVQSLMLAAQSLLVPQFARAYAAGDRTAVERRARQLTLTFTGAAVVVAVLVVVLRHPLVSVVFGRTFLPYTPLMLPVAVSSLLFSARTPYTAACRGMQNARGALVIQIVYTSVTLPCLIVGSVVWGVEGAAWGLAIASVALLAAAYAVFRWTLDDRLPPGGGAHPGAGSDPVLSGDPAYGDTPPA